MSEATAEQTRLWVEPHPSGDGWQVKVEGASRAHRRAPTRQEALAIAKPIAENWHCDLVVVDTSYRTA